MSTSTETTTVWKLDPAHSTLEFSAKHMMITTVKGRFGDVEGTITVPDGQVRDAGVEVQIPVSSIDTGVDKRDDHLRSDDFLNAEKHPHIEFRSTGVDGTFQKAGDTFKLRGDLTIRDTTKPVVLDVTYEGEGQDPWGGTRRSFSATGKLDRREFGLTWNQALETGGVLVSNEVRMALDVQVVRQD
ncbi:MAG: polyisoprenoid-binding protein [Gemmatimonadales bacterium]|nr:MAG: polyisoprenoid-binding protein [Gemmatimonadales bacterium]